MDATLLIALAVIVVVLVLVSQGIRVVQPYQQVVVFRLGKADASSVRGPGLAFLIPVIDRAVTVDLREQFFEGSSNAVTKDNAPVRVDLGLSWRITDPLKMVVSVVNFPIALQALTITTFRDIIAERRLDEVVPGRDRVVDEMRDALEPIIARWGGQLIRVELGEIAASAGGQGAG